MKATRNGQVTKIVDQGHTIDVTVTPSRAGRPAATNTRVLARMGSTYQEVDLIASERQRVDGRPAAITIGKGVTKEGVKVRFVLVTVKGDKARNYSISTFTAAARFSSELRWRCRSSDFSWSFMSALAQCTAAKPIPSRLSARPRPSARLERSIDSGVSPGGRAGHVNDSGGSADRATVLRRLIAADPGETKDLVGLLRTVCRIATRELAASGVGVSVMTADGVRGLSAASDEASEQLEEMQFTFGEGPCFDALADRRPVLISGMARFSVRGLQGPPHGLRRSQIPRFAHQPAHSPSRLATALAR
jgi:hypothetical protein